MATESFFSSASLAYLASAGAGKDGKAYSIKPTDGTGDFTFSRGSNLAATRVGPTGLIEKGRENLLTYSRTFESNWLKQNASVTSGQAGYDGSNNAVKVTADADGSINFQQGLSFANVNTFSVYLKAGNVDFAKLFMVHDGANRTAIFDLVNGTISQDNNGDIPATLTSISNGWYRCTISANSTNGSVVRVRSQRIEGNDNVLAGDFIYIQDAQLEIGLAATDYIESGASTGKAGLLEDEPRFDYSGGATCPSLLLEPSRTQLIGQTEYYESNLLVNASIDTNNATSPEGLQNATLLKEDTNSGNHAMREPSNTSIAADDSQYVISFFAKSNGRNIRFIDDAYAGSSTIVNFNLSSGGTFSNGFLIIDSDAVAFGDGWYYCYAVIDKSSAVQNNFRFSLRLLGGASNNNDSYTGDGTSGVWIWGKQIEDSVSYPTSYIPNHSGGTITRGADDSVVTGVSDLIGQTEGTMFFEGSVEHTPENVSIMNFNRSIQFSVSFLKGADNKINGYVYNGGSPIITLRSEVISGKFKCAIAYKSGDTAFYVNGTQIGVNTTTFTPAATLDEIYIGSYSTPYFAYDHPVKCNQALVFKTRLSSADLETLTTI